MPGGKEHVCACIHISTSSPWAPEIARGFPDLSFRSIVGKEIRFLVLQRLYKQH